MGTVLCQSQLAAITYIDSGTCNLDSEVNVELWVNSAPNLLAITNLVVNTDTSLTMNKLTLTEIEVDAVSKLESITSASISAIGDVLKVTATELKTVKLDVMNGDINYLTAGELGNQIYLETAGDIQTTGLRISKDGKDTLVLDYDTIKRLIDNLPAPPLMKCKCTS